MTQNKPRGEIFLSHFHYKFTPNDSKQLQTTPINLKRPKTSLEGNFFWLFSLQIHSKQLQTTLKLPLRMYWFIVPSAVIDSLEFKAKKYL